MSNTKTHVQEYLELYAGYGDDLKILGETQSKKLADPAELVEGWAKRDDLTPAEAEELYSAGWFISFYITQPRKLYLRQIWN